MKSCCIYSTISSVIFGFFLCFFVMGSLFINESSKHKHDHKTCSKCECEKTCKCYSKKDMCANKCICN